MAQTVEELAEILDNIKLEADRNAENFEKLLTAINNKIEIMSDNTEADDLIKVYLTLYTLALLIKILHVQGK